jgi:hypothetical protein
MDDFTRSLLGGSKSREDASQVRRVATKKVKYEFAGVGAMVQAIGLIGMFFYPVGTIGGIALLIIGSVMSKKIRCSECGNKVDKESLMCPHCRAEFQSD